MFRRLIFIVLVGLLFAACASVPKESVELSATVGRDLAVVHNAHREIAQILFVRMRNDINRFVDNVYTPFQIRNVMNRQQQLAISTDSEDRKRSLLLLINAAFKPDSPQELQSMALKAMGSMVWKIQQDIESMRKELLEPVNAQEVEVLGSIDRAYQQLHYANSIVTGHLSSVAKVHETQAELLQAIGVDRNLRKDVVENLAKASDQIGDLVKDAEVADNKLDKAEESAQKIKDAVKEFKTKLIGKIKEE